MTNGEKIKEIFPQAEIIPQYILDLGLIGYEVCIDGETYFSEEWWNMEYQEPKTGWWIDDKCSVCGKGIEDLIDSQEWYRNEEPNFCPFCGTKMIEPKESE